MSPVLSVCVLVVSDRAARGQMPDGTGPVLGGIVRSLGWECSELKVVPDEKSQISDAIRSWADSGTVHLVLTAGGTGLGPRDVTPEATAGLLDRRADGIIQLMLMRGLQSTPRAALSRGLAGARKKTLIVNLPGSPRGAEESLRAIAEVVPHALAMLGGEGHPEKEKGGR